MDNCWPPSRGHDAAAFTALVQRHGPLVYNVCRRVLGEAADAEDAFQATFLVLVRKAGAIRRPEQLGNWLYGVAYRVAQQARVRAARRQKHERRASAMTTTAPQPEAGWDDLRPLLDAEVSQLPDKYRAPVVLCYFQGRTNEQAAAELGWPAGTVTGRLARARDMLRQRLARRGLEVTGVGLATLLTAHTASAALPTALAQLTVEAATEFTQTAAASSVAALAQGVLHEMFLTKMKRVLFVLLPVALLGVGTATVLTRGDTAPEAAPAVPRAVAAAAPPATDRLGDPLPPDARQRIGSPRFVHRGAIQSVAYSPDAKTLVTAGGTVVQLWHADSGKEQKHFQAHAGLLVPVAVAPDNRTVACGTNDGTVQLWDIASGKELHRLMAHPGGAWALTFARDGKLLATGGQDRNIRLWDAVTGKQVRELTGHQDRVVVVDLAADGKVLASASFDNTIRLWDVATGKETRRFTIELPAHQYIDLAALSPDGKLLAGGGGSADYVQVWEVAGGKPLYRVPVSSRLGGSLTFAPDGKSLAVVGKEHSAEIWDTATGQRRLTLGPDRLLSRAALQFTPDGRTLTAGIGNEVRRWDAQTGNPSRLPIDQPQGMQRIALAPDGKTLVTGGTPSALDVWNPATGARVGTVPGPAGATLSALAFAPDGRTFAAAWNDHVIRLYDAATRRELRALPGHTSTIWSLAFAPDSQTIASGSSDNTTRLWDVATGNPQRLLRGHDSGVLRVAFAPRGNLIASIGLGGPDGTARVWDVASGKELCRIQAGFDDKPAVLTEGRGPRFGAHFRSVAFTENGETLVTTEPTVRCWDVATGKERRRLPALEGMREPVACAPDGRTLASAGPDDTVILWELATGLERRRFTRHQDSVIALAFAADGKTIVSAGKDQTVLFWDVSGRGNPPAVELRPAELDTLWTDLVGPDAARAHQALWRLAGQPAQCLALVQRRFAELATVEPKRVAQLIANLNAERFEDREQATGELEALGNLVKPALLDALKARPPLEAASRIERILKRIQGPTLVGRSLHALRVLEMLEQVGSVEARQFLEAQTARFGDLGLGAEAVASVQRLKRN